MPSPTLTRRALLAGAGATVSSAALAVAIVPAVAADEAPQIDPEIEGLSGLPLAAVHIERAIEAMADFDFGRWQVTITSGDRDQSWGFKQINPRRQTQDPVVDIIAEYQAGIAAYNVSGIPDRLGFSDEEHNAVVAQTYGPSLVAIQNWSAPAVTHEGALAALRFAVAEAADYSSTDTVLPMLSAALAYFENA